MTKEQMKELRLTVLPPIKDLLNNDLNFSADHYAVLNTDEGRLNSNKELKYLIIKHKDNITLDNIMLNTHVGVGFRYGKMFVDLYVNCKDDSVRCERLNRLLKLYTTGRIDNKYSLNNFSHTKSGICKGIFVEYDEFNIFDIINDIKYLCDILDIII